MYARVVAALAAVSVSVVAAVAQSQSPAPMTHGGSPAVSPDGRSIAFVSDRTGVNQIYVIAADGTGERPITSAATHVAGAHWSADGRRLRYSAFADGVSHVFDIGTDGGQPVELVAVAGRGPHVSTDGTRVVFGGGTSWTATALTVADIAAGAVASPRVINDGASIAWNATWSPDSRAIAFTGRDASGLLQVYTVNADGSGRRQLTHHVNADGQAQVPAWSQDAAWIAYQSNGEGGHADLWVVRADGRDAHRVTEHAEPYLDETPSWFPDGQRLAFQSNRSGRMEVWTVGIDGTHPRLVTK